MKIIEIISEAVSKFAGMTPEEIKQYKKVQRAAWFAVIVNGY